MSVASQAGEAEDLAYPSPAYSWYVVGVLYLAYVLAFVDRQIMAFMVGPIRSDLGISDFQFSLVHGLAFVIFYSVLGIPIARLADARNRRNIIATGIGLWSLMTAMCGMAGTFMQLFLVRLGVGVGEATLSPSAISLIADYFPKEKRTLAINIYSAGVHGGAGLANIFGGLVVAFAMTGGLQEAGILGGLRAWQITFLLVALPGLLVALLTFTIREPARRERRATQGSGLSFGDTLAYLHRHALLYGSLMFGAGFAALASYGAFSWVPAMYERLYGWSAAEIGLKFGLITITFGTAGLILSGYAAGAMTRAGQSAPHVRIMVASMVCAALPAAVMVAVHDPYWTLACLALIVFFMSTPLGLVQAALQAVTPNQMRAQVIAIYLLITTIVGFGVGPSSVAAVTDYVFGYDAAVGASVAIVGAAAAVISALVLAVGLGAYRRRTREMDAETAS